MLFDIRELFSSFISLFIDIIFFQERYIPEATIEAIISLAQLNDIRNRIISPRNKEKSKKYYY